MTTYDLITSTTIPSTLSSIFNYLLYISIHLRLCTYIKVMYISPFKNENVL